VELNVFLVVLLAYLLGSVSFGCLTAGVCGIDIRKQGSGNTGATNVFRTMGPGAGIIVFLLDLSKGALPVFLAHKVTQNPWLIILVGAAAILGHTFPLFLRFRGGRGSATGLGVLLGIAPDIFLGALIMTALIILVTRYVSLASLIVPVLVTLAFYLLQRPLPYILISGLATILIILRHIPNIKRLLAGTESKIWKKP
jgi:glycerol-3-phosphate acyltransferase PlsY